VVPATTAPFGDAIAGAFHRARPVAAAVGLGRWRPNGPERLRSARPGILRFELARPRLLFTCAVSPRTLSLAASHVHTDGTKAPTVALPASSKAWLVASSYLASRRREPPCRCQHESPRDAARKMRLTDFCNRLPSRAPTDCSIPGRTTLVTSPSCDVSPHACAWLILGRSPLQDEMRRDFGQPADSLTG